jgi:DNA-binding beta-propeller fold protein YncE
VSVINGTTNTVMATVTVGSRPVGVAVNATTNTVYVGNSDDDTVSVIIPTAPATVPGVPTAVSATAGSGQASVAFTAPASNGGSVITGYTVTATSTATPVNGGQTATGSGSPILVAGLTNGDSYTFTVRATNAIGSGAVSAASTSVTPTAPVASATPPAAAKQADSLAATGSDSTLPLGLAGFLLITGLAVLGAARLRSRAGTSHIG